jgi:trk system potassium uptake protein TrkA
MQIPFGDPPDALVLNSDITDEGFVEEENIGNFDLIITTTDSPELNLVTALYAKKQG